MSYDHVSRANDAFSLSGSDLFPRPSLSLSVEVVTLKERQSRDEEISRAVSRLIPAALQCRQGILVMQHNHDKYTIRIDQEVPFGTTREASEWDRAKSELADTTTWFS
ncbi:hypothetical protein ACFFGR_17415 [Arthrobacter liuii]|uniref:hypothetical protein n=1 Tax=Arthrobacter liuii TaxID=1476996 RepID=UPI001E6243BC|nr:hypothetical protein [Arthrobacter liuii]